MTTEIEAKFLDVDISDLKRRLKKLDAELTLPETLMKRCIIKDTHGEMKKSNAYIRVRDEGRVVTLTYKQFTGSGVAGAQEIETTVGSYDKTIELFEKLGYTVASLQQTKREVWRMGSVDIMIDTWPWLNTFIEIEGESEADVRACAEKLGLTWGDAVFGGVDAAYKAVYSEAVDVGAVTDLPEMLLGTPVPSSLRLKGG